MAKVRNGWALTGIVTLSLLMGGTVVACSAGSSGDGGEDDAGSAGPGSGGAGGSSTSANGASSQGGAFVGSGGNVMTCNSTAETDLDMDGFKGDVDCDDCDESINPNAVEVVAEPTERNPDPTPGDEDCDGMIDNVLPPCDSGLSLADEDPMNAAKAMDVCHEQYVLKVNWVLADGSPPPVDPTHLANFHLGHGILPDLGPNVLPQNGESMLMISSGTARRETDPGFVARNFNKIYTCSPPFGFPKDSPSCPGVTTGACTDSTGLEIEFRAPANAKGFSFDFNFFTYEWPNYICSTYNDFFVANLVLQGNKFPMGQQDGNISFDAMGNPISVNNAFLDVCGCPNGPPCACPPGNSMKSFDCAFGKTGVDGTPFEADTVAAGWTNGSSGWLRTEAIVEPDKTFKLRVVTYDSGDHNVDSSTLVDNFQWLAEAKPGTDIAK